jgi:hypothetical protein
LLGSDFYNNQGGRINKIYLLILAKSSWKDQQQFSTDDNSNEKTDNKAEVAKIPNTWMALTK